MKMFKVLSVMLFVFFLCSQVWGTPIIGYDFSSDSGNNWGNFSVIDRSGGTYFGTNWTGEYLGTIQLNNDSSELLEYLIGIYLDDPLYSIVSYDKVDIPENTSSAGSLTNDTDGDGNFLTVSWDNEVKSGEWNTSPLYTSFYSVKGSDEFALYYVDPAVISGIWTTAHLLNNGGQIPSLSHLDAVTTSAPVPEPTTMLLSGIGLMGMGFYLRRKKVKKEIIL